MELRPIIYLWDAVNGREWASSQLKLRGTVLEQSLRTFCSFHNPTMNGGVTHSFEMLDREEVARLLEAYHFLGFGVAASQLVELYDEFVHLGDSWDDEFEFKANDWYYDTFPSDSHILDSLAPLVEQYEASYPSLPQ